MIDREQLSLRQAVAWLITIRSASRLLQLASPTRKRAARVTGRRVDRTWFAALDRALANPTVLDRYRSKIRSKIVNAPDSDWLWGTGAISCRL
jgi:hypothetical protein